MCMCVKGLDEIECVPINIFDKPPWYKEKVYHVGKVSFQDHDKMLIASKFSWEEECKICM